MPPIDPANSETPAFPKNRFLSLVPGNAGRLAAIRVTFVDLPDPYDAWEGVKMWVGEPQAISENAGKVDPAEAPGWPTFTAVTFHCALQPEDYRNWSTLGTIHLYHEGIVPGGTYDVQEIHQLCDPAVEASYSLPLRLDTSIWADIVSNCATDPCGPPDGVVGIPTDVTAVLDKFKNLDGAPIKARADIEPQIPDHSISITDVTYVLDAFRGSPYPFSPSGPPPCGGRVTAPGH